MATLSSSSKMNNYKAGGHYEINKASKARKLANRLAKKKAWRLRKFTNETIKDLSTLSGTTVKLLRREGVIKRDKIKKALYFVVN